jgi:hypothetical protein
MVTDTIQTSQHADRRSFLWALTSLSLVRGKSHKQVEAVYRFAIPECEVEMSVEYFERSAIKNFRFRDSLTNRAFCLSANGERNQNCLERFSGSIAIARYRVRSRLTSHMSFSLREHVLTIDRDVRIDPRPPFERVLPVDGGIVSDIQAFGYNLDDPKQAAFGARPFTLWCLLRQDLYLNEQATAFLIVHWKHTLDSISIVDVIPGDRTQVISN